MTMSVEEALELLNAASGRVSIKSNVIHGDLNKFQCTASESLSHSNLSFLNDNQRSVDSVNSTQRLVLALTELKLRQVGPARRWRIGTEVTTVKYAIGCYGGTLPEVVVPLAQWVVIRSLTNLIRNMSFHLGDTDDE